MGCVDNLRHNSLNMYTGLNKYKPPTVSNVKDSHSEWIVSPHHLGLDRASEYDLIRKQGSVLLPCQCLASSSSSVPGTSLLPDSSSRCASSSVWDPVTYEEAQIEFPAPGPDLTVLDMVKVSISQSPCQIKKEQGQEVSPWITTTLYSLRVLLRCNLNPHFTCLWEQKLNGASVESQEDLPTESSWYSPSLPKLHLQLRVNERLYSIDCVSKFKYCFGTAGRKREMIWIQLAFTIASTFLSW